VIGTRTAAAVSLVLSVAAVAIAVFAFATAVTNDDDGPGRVVQTRVINVRDGEPIPYTLDDFYLSSDRGGRAVALYMYPPGFYGRTRGCRVVWISDDVQNAGGRRFGPGLFVDPCGGARFDRDGTLLFGEAERDLDRFRVQPEVEGFLVDTRELYCGRASRPLTPDPPQPPPSPPAVATTPTRVLPPVTPTPTETSTPQPTATEAASPTGESEKCDRVTAGD
jgi:hypothetical protein